MTARREMDVIRELAIEVQVTIGLREGCRCMIERLRAAVERGELGPHVLALAIKVTEEALAGRAQRGAPRRAPRRRLHS